MPDPTPIAAPRSVLFACNLNRVRSPMAAALLTRTHGRRIVVDSCGLIAGEGIDPFAWASMAEIGVDLTDHAPKTFKDLEFIPFELIISLTPEAHRHVEARYCGRDVALECWEIEDPTTVEGSREQRLDAYRAVREALTKRLADRFSTS